MVLVVTRLDGFQVVWGPVLFGYLVLAVMAGEAGPARPHTFSEALPIVGLLIGVLGVLTTATWGLNRLRDLYFPVATFAIGQGARRHQLRETIRWVVVVGFLVSLAASVFVGLLM